MDDTVKNIKNAFVPDTVGIITNIALPFVGMYDLFMLGCGSAIIAAFLFPFTLLTLFLVKPVRETFSLFASFAIAFCGAGLLQLLATPLAWLSLPILAICSRRKDGGCGFNKPTFTCSNSTLLSAFNKMMPAKNQETNRHVSSDTQGVMTKLPAASSDSLFSSKTKEKSFNKIATHTSRSTFSA